MNEKIKKHESQNCVRRSCRPYKDFGREEDLQKRLTQYRKLDKKIWSLTKLREQLQQLRKSLIEKDGSSDSICDIFKVRSTTAVVDIIAHV